MVQQTEITLTPKSRGFHLVIVLFLRIALNMSILWKVQTICLLMPSQR